MKTITLVTILSNNGTTAVIKVNDKEYITKCDSSIDSMPIGREFLCTVRQEGSTIIIKRADVKLDNDTSLNIIS